MGLGVSVSRVSHVTIMVGYMSDTTGLTKDAGWEMGVRQTVPAPLPVVWEYLTGEGLPIWLGEIDALPTEKGAEFETRDGVRGSIRSYTELQRIRISWQPDDWPHDTTLQITVKEAATGTTIGFHHDRLADRAERKMMLGHWKNVAAVMLARFGG
jgi:uncharacterized protein YndB with AHSA1/START domain